MKRIFELAIKLMNESGKVTFGPMSFQMYLSEIGDNKRTAQYISIDSIKRLPEDLRENNVMVFRLGSPTGERNTYFALAKTFNGWEDYFLIDENIFSNASPEVFVPPVSVRQLFAFQLLPTFTETSLVNLAISSGLLSYALGMDDNEVPSAPATGQSTYTFRFRPNSKIESQWEHHQGQVEIDAVFIGKRKGKETLFVVEAKNSLEFDTLAKHKIVYPILALSGNIPRYMPIVPVYLRGIKSSDGIHFYLAECTFPANLNTIQALNTLEVKECWHYVLSGFTTT